MIEVVTWRESLEEARSEARQHNKDVMIDLFNPGGGGCRYMAANTYQDSRVARIINEFAIPVQFNVKVDPGARARYHAHWTPFISYQDADGAEYRRSFGPLDADQFMAEFCLARALRFIHSGRFEEGVEAVEQALCHSEQTPLKHAEGLYWHAIARYEAPDGELSDLLEGWEKVRRCHPGTEWDSKTRLILD